MSATALVWQVMIIISLCGVAYLFGRIGGR